jgi:hypothetical protein
MANPIAMNLMMFLGNDLIEAIPLDKENIPIPGYLGRYKRLLKEKYRDTIQQFPDPPDFFVIEPQVQNSGIGPSRA